MSGVALAALAVLAAAPVFEGSWRTKVEGRGAHGTTQTAVSSQGVRAQSQLTMNGKVVSTVVLIRAAEPEVAWVQSGPDAWHKKPVGGSARAAARPLKARRLGKMEVAGVACDQVLLEDGAGQELEYCTASKFGKAALPPLAIKAMQFPPNVEKALQSVGALGAVLYMQVRQNGAVNLTFRVEKVEAQKLPKELFAAPK